MAAETARRVAELLVARGETLAVAESSTGGLILSLLTDVPGASRWLRGGVVPYSDEAKERLVGVSAPTLSRYGTVSAETAIALARGARTLFKATWALGETGITGPQAGRRSAKPAGLTFLAVAGVRDGAPLERAERVLVANPGDRRAVKRAFAESALALLLQTLQTLG